MIKLETMNKLVPYFVLLIGFIMAYGLYKDETNIILTFGFMLIALIQVWSKK